MLKLAINGLGRIGRAALKIAQEDKEIKVVGVNDLAQGKTLAHLIAYDSVYGRYPKKVTAEGDNLILEKEKIPFFSKTDPREIPWGKLGVEVVLECTGVFKDSMTCQKHLEAGAQRVIISAPPKDETKIICLGCNEEDFNPKTDQIISNASCTTNCLAPIVKIIDREIGIDQALMTTIHSYTSSQNLVDGPCKDLRRARAAGLNIVPSTTGAAIAVTRVLPQLKGKFDGMAFRVPSPCVSVVDLVVKLRQSATIEKINSVLITAANSELKGILKTEAQPLVSSDFLADPHSSIVDLQSTMMVGKEMAKIIAWYDNEWGYSKRLVELASYLKKKENK